MASAAGSRPAGPRLAGRAFFELGPSPMARDMLREERDESGSAPVRNVMNDFFRWPSDRELAVARVGLCERPPPVPPGRGTFVDDRDRVIACRTSLELAPFLEAKRDPPSLERAGARRSIYFDATTLTCGILTCGGLCP